MMLKDQSVKICVLQKGESTISLRAAATLGISHISIVQEHLWTEQLSYLLTKKYMAEEEDKKKVMEEEEVEHPDFGIGWDAWMVLEWMLVEMGWNRGEVVSPSSWTTSSRILH